MRMTFCKLIIVYMVVLASSCAAFSPHAPKPQTWVVSEAAGRSFTVKGHTGWFRLPQSDTLALHPGDTIYINHTGHEDEGKVTRWHTRRKYKE